VCAWTAPRGFERVGDVRRGTHDGSWRIVIERTHVDRDAACADTCRGESLNSVVLSEIFLEEKKMAKLLNLFSWTLVAALCAAPTVCAQTTEFSYQGSLKEGANAA